MAYQSNLLGDFWRGYRQRRIGSGTPLSQNEMGGLIGPLLANDAAKAREQGLLDERRRSQALQEKAFKQQQMAGMIGGVGQLAMLPLAYKLMSPAKAAAPALGAGTAQAAVAPAAASTLPAQGLASAAYPGLAGGTAVPGAVGPMSPIMAEAPAAAASPGLLGGASLPGIGLAGGLLAGQMALGKALQPTLDKAGFPTAGKLGSYAGLPGMVTGGMIDLGKKGFEAVKDIFGGISDLF